MEDWLDKYEIDINAEKSEIVVYNGNQKPNIEIKDKLLKITNNYKYDCLNKSYLALNIII